MSTSGPSFALVGSGAVASALAPRWCERGARLVGLASRDRAGAARLATSCGALDVEVREHARELALGCELLLLAVPDAQIVPVAQELAQSGASAALFAHASGAVPSAALAPLATGGAALAAIHPLLALPPGRTAAIDWANAHFGLEGDARAVELARGWVERLGARSFAVRPDAKALYHAAAVLASNDLVALLAEAQRCLHVAAPEAPPSALLSLAESALRALRERDGAAVQALSGPLVRGDLGTVREHLAAFDRLALDGGEAERLREVYVALLRAALPLAELARGEAERRDGALRELEQELARSRSRGGEPRA
ncbi:MAG: DUF2520 domain-containing protein [Planctomycetes bacterium]|nr:DUF2520 domain-containing protein [Planctomycetota bacterium]